MESFYLQDSRFYIGNDMVWWSKEGKKFTTDLDKARMFTQAEAMAMHHVRHTDIPWPVDYIREHSQCSVDMQCVHRSHLLQYGIKLDEDD